MLCRKCGKELSPNSKYCSQCGTPCGPETPLIPENQNPKFRNPRWIAVIIVVFVFLLVAILGFAALISVMRSAPDVSQQTENLLEDLSAEDVSFPNPISYWNLDPEQAETSTQERDGISYNTQTLNVEKVDDYGFLEDYAAFLQENYDFTLEDTLINEEGGSYSWGYYLCYAGPEEIALIPDPYNCHLFIGCSAHSTWEYAKVECKWIMGLTPFDSIERSDVELTLLTDNEHDNTAENSDAVSQIQQEAADDPPVASDPVLVAEAMASTEVTHSSTEIMGLEFYAESLSMEKLKESDGVSVRSFSGDAADYQVLKAYVELLCDSYDFELVNSPYWSKIKDTFFDFTLRYTGSASLSGEQIDGTFSKDTGNLMIYGTIDGDRLKGAIWYDRMLTTYDGGYRYGEEQIQTGLVGPSATAGLYRMPDGSFATTDGRLQANVGEAVVLQDGKAVSCTAQYTVSADSNRQEILVTNHLGVPQLRFYFPAGYTMTTGDIYGEQEFIIESDYAVNDNGRFSDMPQYTWPSMFAALHNGDYVVPVLGMGGDMKRVNVRVMYTDASVTVFYACAQLNSAPYEIETLIAVSPTKAESSTSGQSGSSSWCSACNGSGKCTACGGIGKKKKLLAGTSEWVTQDCTFCRPVGSGNCTDCGGTGKR